MQSPEETFFAAIIVPHHVARHNHKWDGALSARFRARR